MSVRIGTRERLSLWLLLEGGAGVLFLIVGIAMLAGGIYEEDATNLHRLKHYIFGGVSIIMGVMDLWQAYRLKRDLARYHALHDQHEPRRKKLLRWGYSELIGGLVLPRRSALRQDTRGRMSADTRRC